MTCEQEKVNGQRVKDVIGITINSEIAVMESKDKQNVLFFYANLRNLNKQAFNAAVKILKYTYTWFLNFICSINYLLVHINAAYKKLM